MTSEPADPHASEPPDQTAEAGAAPGRAAESGTWEAAGDAEEESWQAENEATLAPPAQHLPELDEGQGDEEDDEEDFNRPARHGPWRLSHLMILVVVVALLLWVWIMLGPVSVLLLGLAAIVLAITSGFILARLKATRHDALLSILAIAAERGMPLAPAVAAFADQFRGGSHGRVMNVASQLNAGTPLPEALNTPSRAVSRDAILMAWIGHDTGLLAPALRLAVASRFAQIGTWTAIAIRLGYLLVMLMFAEAITGFMLYFILPKLEAIFSDFDTPLPRLTISVIAFSHLLFQYAPLVALVILAEIAVFLYIPFSFAGWMNYQLPIIDRLMGRRHSALVLRALSVVVEAGHPMASGLATLAEHYPARWVRRRLSRALANVRLGNDWIDALWRAGIVRRSEAEVLASAASVGNLAWACRELADTTDRRQQHRIQVLIQTIFPAAVLILGLSIAFVCIGYFIPVVSLIQRLTG